jgi:CPA1 family monovalent cation:H+ antiporter
LYTASDAPFPQRDTILAVTFGVIVITLVGQGLLLPSVVKRLGLARHSADEHRREAEAELAARADALAVAERRLDELAGGGGIAPDVLAALRLRHDYRAARLPHRLAQQADAAAAAADIRTKLIAAERAHIYKLLQDGRITDEARRHIERELDLEEAGIACKKEGGVEPPL